MRILAALASLPLAACSPALAHPPYPPQPQGALVEVSSSPPPGRVEMVPARPSRSAVWIDGEWVWKRGRWAWLPGRWVDAPPGASFSPWVFVRGPEGRLWHAGGVWRSANGSPVDAPRPLAGATVGSYAVVNASGEIENTGPTLHSPRRAAGKLLRGLEARVGQELVIGQGAQEHDEVGLVSVRQRQRLDQRVGGGISA